MENTINKKTVFIVAIIALVIGIVIGSIADNNKRWHKNGYKKTDKEMMSGMEHREMENMMMSMSQMLEGKTGDEFDKAFIDEMIVHHEGAIVMAQKVLEISQREELKKLANDIITAQTKEIDMMKSWRENWFK